MENLQKKYKDAYIEVFIGQRRAFWPVPEYLDIEASRMGYKDYQDRLDHGHNSDISEDTLYREVGYKTYVPYKEKETVI